MNMIAGKTKIITPLWPGAKIASVTTKDDITAGDGAKYASPRQRLGGAY
jgi:hypothetical protein